MRDPRDGYAILWRTYPNEMTRGRIRTETLLTSGSKRNGNVAVAWTLGRQEPKIFLSGSVALVGIFDKMMHTVLNLTHYREIRLHCITRHVGNLVNNERMHGIVITVHRENAGFDRDGRESGR